MVDHLTPGQVAVLRAFYEFGDMTDVALATYVHHVSEVNMSSSGIRTRRAELCRTDPPLLRKVDHRITKSGREAGVHRLTSEGYLTAAEILTERNA